MHTATLATEYEDFNNKQDFFKIKYRKVVNRVRTLLRVYHSERGLQSSRDCVRVRALLFRDFFENVFTLRYAYLLINI